LDVTASEIFFKDAVKPSMGVWTQHPCCVHFEKDIQEQLLIQLGNSNTIRPIILFSGKVKMRANEEFTKSK
jgi:hypothetical protein